MSIFMLFFKIIFWFYWFYLLIFWILLRCLLFHCFCLNSVSFFFPPSGLFSNVEVVILNKNFSFLNNRDTKLYMSMNYLAGSSKFWYVLFLFSISSKYFPISLDIILSTVGLFKTVLLHFQIFEDFPTLFLLFLI